MNWILLWKGILIFTLSGYFLLVIIVSIGGAKNVVEMINDLKAPIDSSD